MSLSLDEVRHIAKLARLELADGDVDATQAKLNGIFGLIEEMQAVNTDGVEPMSHPNQEPPDLPLRVRPPEGGEKTWGGPAFSLAQRLRPDVVTEVNRRDAFQAIAPQTEAGLYLVPKVIE